MTGASRYAELSSAVRSFKAELIRPTQIERIMEAGSLSETVAMLTGGRISATDSVDMKYVESQLVEGTIALTERLASYAPYDSRGLIRLFSVSYELACAKEILRAIIEHADPEIAVTRIVPAGRFTFERCKEMIETRNPNRVIEALQDEALKQFLLAKLMNESALAAVAAVDQFYYSRLWAASNLPDPLDGQSARGLIGPLIDHMNILLALRAKLVGLDARSTTDLFIPVNYALAQSVHEFAESTNVQNVIRVLEKTPYSRAIIGQSGLDGDVGKVERLLNRDHAAICLNAFAGYPFNVGIALAFLFLKSYELRDLFTIINAKSNNVSTERVVDLLILAG